MHYKKTQKTNVISKCSENAIFAKNQSAKFAILLMGASERVENVTIFSAKAV
jgi:hypothetical protein